MYSCDFLTSLESIGFFLSSFSSITLPFPLITSSTVLALSSFSSRRTFFLSSMESSSALSLSMVSLSASRTSSAISKERVSSSSRFISSRFISFLLILWPLILPLLSQVPVLPLQVSPLLTSQSLRQQVCVLKWMWHHSPELTRH